MTVPVVRGKVVNQPRLAPIQPERQTNCRLVPPHRAATSRPVVMEPSSAIGEHQPAIVVVVVVVPDVIGAIRAIRIDAAR